MKSVFLGLGVLGAVGLLMAPACGSGTGTASLDADGGDDGGGFQDRNVGGRCDQGGACRPGLVCISPTCQPGHASEAGAACVISAECKDGLYCGPARTCAPAGPGAAGETCASDGDCRSGLRCNIVGLGTACEPEGSGDIGSECATSSACFGGLLCVDKACAPPPPGDGPPPLGVPAYKGVQCEAEPGPVIAHFRVPRGTGDADYFRLPFPNDIRRKGGRLDLTGFPTPGSDLLGFDLVDRWARYLETTGSGWSAYPTVTFRFSGEIDFESMRTGTRWVDLTAGDQEIAHSWGGTTNRTAYVCPNGVSFRPATGEPLKPGHTYAVMITKGAKAKDGTPVQPSPDLAAVVGPTDPGGDLSAAHAAYAPLRTWAAGHAFDLGTLLDVSVFTVGTHDVIARKLATAVAAATAPAATGWTKCGGGAVSPCAQAEGGRACPAAESPSFDELHALVSLPLFQQGALPFLAHGDGGDVVLDGDGVPIPQGTVSACLALTVPKGVMPAGGWPVVVYAHGTGGSFRSHINEGVAARLASVESTRIAVLGIDQVGHGTRRGSSTMAPQNVFFNFTNPPAARGNVLQGAADQMSLVRFARALTLAAGTSPTGAEIRFGDIAFWGHSQGATEGAVAMPYTADVRGAVFSGVGGSLIDSLLTKKSPVNLVSLAPALLSEAPQHVGASHPALGMLQNAIDPADPLDHAAAIVGNGPLAKHVFVPYGQNDTYSPPITQLTYLLAANLAVAQHPPSVATPDDLKRTLTPVPVGGNAATNITAVARQYAPAGYDGHFVAFQNADGKVDVDRFLVDALSGVVPKVGR